MSDDEDIYTHFWIYLAYFFSLIFFVMGYMDNLQNYIYYGLFFLLMGLTMTISYKLSMVIDILQDENDEFNFYEDSD